MSLSTGLKSFIGFGGSQAATTVKSPSIGSQFASFFLSVGQSIAPLVPQIIAQKVLPKAVASQFTPAAQQQQQQQQQQFQANLQGQTQQQAVQAEVSSGFAKALPVVLFGGTALVIGGVLIYVWRRGGR